jgi:hypothetical protein
VSNLSAVAARRVLLLAAVLLLPVPYWAIEVERAPVARLLFITAVTAAAAISEPGGAVSIVAPLLAAESLLWLLALAVAARLAVRWLPERRRTAAVALAVAALVVVSLLPVYHTPFARGGSDVGLRGILG